ncbi:MAG: hypothetical protein II937_03845 [Bacteroidales bacterium]|nr:hypothetical protein [Bacteroidales bacterium]
MRRYITLFLLASFIFTACNNTENTNTPIRIEIPEFNPEEEVAMDEQIEANEILTEISQPKTAKSKSLYEEYYGGGFMDKHGNLTIMVKGDTAIGPKIVDKKRNNGKIKFVKCKYSLAELNELMDIVDRYFDNNKDAVTKNLSAWGVSEDDNVLEVCLFDTSYSAIKEFKKKVSDSPAIKFLQGEEFIEENTHLYSGSKLSKQKITGTTIKEPPYGSYGFRAREKFGNHRVGMVTAAHVIAVNGKAYLGYDEVGICTQSVLGGSIDAAFISVNDTNNFTPSNYLSNSYPDKLSTTTSLPGKGSIVNLRGATTGHSTGSVINTNYRIITPQGIKLSNMTSATYDSDEGDSGGIIYTYVSKTSTRYTVGVHRGMYKGYKVYSKASNVLSTLNLERY